MNLLRSFVTKYEPLAFTFVKVFAYSFVGSILAFWFGLTPFNVSGLWNAIDKDYAAALGVAVLAALGAVGIKVPQAIKTKTL